MDKNIFLAKIKNSDERDVVYYINFRGFECDHYFGGMRLGGACFCGYEKEFRDMVENDFDNLETILTKGEYMLLFKLSDDIRSLGYNITIGSDNYKKGLKEILQVNPVIFQYKDDKSGSLRIGVIAQEVKKVFPEAVVTMDNGYYGVNSAPIFFASMNALKEINEPAYIIGEVTNSGEVDLKW